MMLDTKNFFKLVKRFDSKKKRHKKRKKMCIALINEEQCITSADKIFVQSSL